MFFDYQFAAFGSYSQYGGFNKSSFVIVIPGAYLKLDN